MHQQEPAERQVHRLWQRELLGRLGEDDRLARACLRRGGGNLVAPGRVAIDGEDPAVPAHQARQGHAHVTAASADVKKALDAHALAAAQALVGKTGAFQGTVSQVYVPRNNGRVILDFDPNYHAALTAVVNPDAYAKFPNLAGLAGKRVWIQGKFGAYHHSPQVELTSPAQVKVIVGK